MSDFIKFVIASAIGGLIAGVTYDIFREYFAHRTPYRTDDRIEASNVIGT